MEFTWIDFSTSEVTWIALAFLLGLLSRAIALPPLVGYLAAGFLLHTLGAQNSPLLESVAELGITLLLFTVGLKLNLRTLARPQVWAVSAIHMTATTSLLCLGLWLASYVGIAGLASLDLGAAALVAFALSFSSTVFVVKALEDRGAVTSLHGRVAVGILLMQDIAAVVFLAVSAGYVPSLWALSLLLLIPLKPFLTYLLRRTGHEELLVLFGFMLALGGAELFELIGIKGDLGALIMGVLIAGDAKAEEMSKAMIGFKDLFLLGFFLTIGLSGQPSQETLWLALLVTPLVFAKSALFFALMTRTRLRARTSLLAALNLGNYSEFGLIVAAIGVTEQWISPDWLMVIALALSFSFVISATLNRFSDHWYRQHIQFWQRFQREDLITDDKLLDLGDANILIIGMGGVGIGAYDLMAERFGGSVVGVDIDPMAVTREQFSGRVVLRGDPSDADFWDRVEAAHSIRLVLLALPKESSTLAVLERLSEASFTGHVAATARFPDEAPRLMEAGASSVFSLHAEAGAGFAAHAAKQIPSVASAK